MAYTREVGDNLYRFGSDTHVDDDFSETSSLETNAEDWTTVARLDVDKGKARAFGRGDTTNPQQAEGFLYFDARAASDTTGAEGNPDEIKGKVRFVVQNPNNETVAEISRHDLDTLRSGSAAASDRQNRQPYPRQRIKGGKAEIGAPYKVGIQIQASSSYGGDHTFDLAGSELIADGHTGTVQG